MIISVTKKNIDEAFKLRKQSTFKKTKILPEFVVLYDAGYLCPVARALTTNLKIPVSIGKPREGRWYARAWRKDGQLLYTLLGEVTAAWLVRFENTKASATNLKAIKAIQPFEFSVPPLEQWQLDYRELTK